MSKTSFNATRIKYELEKLAPGLEKNGSAHRALMYILDRLWPELDAAIKEELPEKK